MRSPASYVAVVSGALVTLPLWVDLAISDRARKFGLLAADAFYYFTVARNISLFGSISFDQERATNGFHPVWQAITAALHFVLHRLGLDDAALMVVALVLGAAAIGGGVFLLGRAAALERGWLSPLFALLPLGGLSLLCLPWLSARWGEKSGRIWSSLWSGANGMETGCVILAFGVVAYLYVKRLGRLKEFALFGAALAALTLSRLDHGIFALAFALLVALEVWSRPGAVRSLSVMFACYAGPLILYLALNRVYAGLWLPISGTLKSTLPKFTNSNVVVLRQLFFEDRAFAPTQAMRGMLLFLPMACAVVYLGIALRVRPAPPGARGIVLCLRTGFRRYEAFLVATALGVLGLGLYNVLYVPVMNMGHWYFPLSSLFVSLGLVRVLEDLPVARWLGPGRAPLFAWLGLAAMGTAVLAAYVTYRSPAAGKDAAAFYYEEVPRISAHYGGQIPKLLAYDDGLIAYSTGAPTMSGLGLALDAAAVPRIGGASSSRERDQSLRLIEVAFARGFLRFTSFGYMDAKLSATTSDKQIRKHYEHLIGGWAKKYVFSVEYLSPDRSFSIIRAEPKG